MSPKTMLTKISGIVLLQILLSCTVASALTISPAREEMMGDKGQSISKTLLLINDQPTDQVLYTSVEAFDSQGESGTPNFTKTKEGLPSWITVAEKVTLKKGERIAVPYTITVPQDAAAGGHFAAIFFSTVPPSADNSQVSVGAKVGMLILFKVTGDIKEGGAVAEFKLKESGKILESLPVNFVYRFNNSGNDRVKPLGEIIVRNTFGIKIDSLNANEKEGNVLPNSTRRYEVHYGPSTNVPTLASPFFEHVKYQMSNFAFGMYTATLQLSYGNEGKASSAITYFMFPWQLLSVIVLTLLILIAILIVLVKKYNKWIIKQARAAQN